MIRISVCDDNTSFLENAVSIIKKWSEQSGIAVEIFSFDNGDDLITKNEVCRMDIIFLDIIMPLLNGMETAKEIRKADTAVNIIFLTSSPEFALESYEVKARGYLLKPVSYDKWKELLDDCSHGFDVEPKNLVLKTEFGYQKLYYRDIEYIEAQNKVILFYMRNGKIIKTAETLRSFESKLNNSEGFFKCHRSYLVYIPNVENFNLTEITTKSGCRIPIARGYGKAFKEAYFNYMFQD
ncbi:MAG: LytTR family DNA-binding domain-containing protein [Lachnospiraceae bacterium]|nr:LytTR family DNA-binding domain-containing protein [Lachnospiraceae bacterium]